MKLIPIFFLLLSSGACNSKDKTYEIEETTITPITQPERLCIDTNVLNQMGVLHRRILEADKETWLLKFTKPVEGSNISTLSYFYSWPPIGKDCSDDSRWFQVDSIQVQLTDQRSHTLKILKHTAGTGIDGLNAPDSRLIDINFDGYPDVDIGLNEVSGVTNEIRSYFVFNPTKSSFENGIELANVGLDKEAKLLYTSWSGGHAGRISNREWSSFVGYDSIRLEKSIQSDFDKGLEAYVVKTTTISAAGDYETKVDTMNYED